MTIAANLSDMFRQIQAIGSDLDRRGSIHTASVVIDGMTVGGD